MHMVVLADIEKQSRLSLGSYRCPRMPEDLKELGVDVGYRRVGRLMRENGIVVERTHIQGDDGRTWETRRQTETSIFQYINGFPYPRRRSGQWTLPTTSCHAVSPIMPLSLIGSAGVSWPGSFRSRSIQAFALRLSKKALVEYGKRKIFNTDKVTKADHLR
jgi:hypothetical protein